MSALEYFLPKGQTVRQTDRVTPWAPVGAKKYQSCQANKEPDPGVHDIVVP